MPMVPAGEPSSSAGPSSKKPKHFEIKKWNAVALWAWDIIVDNCVICRNHITNEEEAKKKIYNVSCERYFGFGCQIDEETSNKLEGLPGVLFVLPVSQFPLMWISASSAKPTRLLVIKRGC